MTLAWLQLSYWQTEAYFFFDRKCGCVHYRKNSRLVARHCLLPPKSPIPVTKSSPPFTCARGLFTFRPKCYEVTTIHPEQGLRRRASPRGRKVKSRLHDALIRL